ncbi:MAG: DUF1013 domain-containing protein [Rhizobiaceae bacterium]
MAKAPLMPKATAVWLVDNTSLTFDQIAEFCALHPLEVRAIADGESAQGIKGMDPISAGQLSRDELDKAQSDGNFRMKVAEPKVIVPPLKRKGPRYTPLSKRQDRPNAILWLVRNHPELKDSQIIRLVGTTKNTIEAVRERTHWNSTNLAPMDPVTLGICTQIAMDFEVNKAAKWAPKPVEVPEEEKSRLLPASETQSIHAPSMEKVEAVDAESVFANFAKTEEETDTGS